MAYHLEFEKNEHVKVIKPLVENFLARKPADIFMISDDGETVATHKMLLSIFSRSLANILSDHQESAGVPSISVPMKAQEVRNLVRILEEGTVFGEDKEKLLAVAKCGKLLGIEILNLQIWGKFKRKGCSVNKRVVNELRDVSKNNHEKLVAKPKYVVPKDKEKQIHHTYKDRSGICMVNTIANSYKDLFDLTATFLRHEASKHKVTQSSRKQKPQVVKELWEHYLQFHLNTTEHRVLEGKIEDPKLEHKDTNNELVDPKLELLEPDIDIIESNMELEDPATAMQEVCSNFEQIDPDMEPLNPNSELYDPTIQPNLELESRNMDQVASNLELGDLSIELVNPIMDPTLGQVANNLELEDPSIQVDPLGG